MSCALCCLTGSLLFVLSLLQAAISLDIRNPLARFELAGVLMVQERLQEALQEMQELAVSS